jgi:phosphoribosylanthranilate isomerase
MRVRVKVCGITRLQDALAAVEMGADAIGFNFVAGSPRRIPADRARDIGAALPPFITRVGVFANARLPSMDAEARLAGVDWLQLHGEESPEACASVTLRWYKALRVTPDFAAEDVVRYGTVAVLLDAYAPGLRGGTGRTFDWGVARRAAAYTRVIVAGGLDEGNVEEAIRSARPFAVDVNSGVECSPGIKDRDRLASFMSRVRAAAGEDA